MPSVAYQQQPVSVSGRPPSIKDMDSRTSSASNANAHPPPGPAAGKKGKAKKNPDPMDTKKILEQTMARLERDAAGNREEEIEIGRLDSCFASGEA
jgi:hypothetical protein